jgi:hypothetical protein
MCQLRRGLVPVACNHMNWMQQEQGKIAAIAPGTVDTGLYDNWQ